MFSHFSNFEVSPEMFKQNLADLSGVSMYPLLLNVSEKFHYLNVTNSTSVPTFCNFSENRLFLDSN